MPFSLQSGEYVDDVLNNKKIYQFPSVAYIHSHTFCK